MKRREQRLLLQLVLCGTVFLLLVAVKLLLPTRMEQLQIRLNDAMEENMDVRAVFSAVGRAFSGESALQTAAEDVYQAVFSREDAVEVSGPVSVMKPEYALAALRRYRADEESSDASSGASNQTEVSDVSYILYSDQNLPESVSMEQAVLGFDYCVPVSGTLSSGFGYRDHPIEGDDRFHYGLDLAADTGTKIVCFADGSVTAVGESSSYGKYCVVEHENGYSTLYAHCDRIMTSSGKTVRKGEEIAEVGSTGMATGPHLHFELQHDGIYLNPIYYVSEI